MKLSKFINCKIMQIDKMVDEKIYESEIRINDSASLIGEIAFRKEAYSKAGRVLDGLESIVESHERLEKQCNFVNSLLNPDSKVVPSIEIIEEGWRVKTYPKPSLSEDLVPPLFDIDKI